MEGFASVFYISNKSRLLAFAARTRRRIPLKKRRRCNAVFGVFTHSGLPSREGGSKSGNRGESVTATAYFRSCGLRGRHKPVRAPFLRKKVQP